MRIAIFSDIHGNFDALQTVSGLLDTVDFFCILGDIVGYGAEPEACVQWVMHRPDARVVMGNHDAACVGVLPLTWFNPIPKRALRWTCQHLSKESTTYLQTLPQTIPQLHGALWVHGSPRHPLEEYIDHPVVAQEVFVSSDFPVCFYAHTHQAEAYILHEGRLLHPRFQQGGEIILHPGKRYLINCGSVGQPRDGNSQASFGLFDTEKGVVKIQRTEYNMESAAEKIREAGLPEELALRLFLGQ
ncbi:MAG: metallophosphoesterase family protein [Candidatus Atribacteria bacterium]|nr:metallophosphoesterase family protein [Candidatus Atribacteria bacterium]